MNDPADWDAWILTNPPPDLQAFVAQHGGSYAQISPEAWNQWDYAVTAWETARRNRLLGSNSWAIPLNPDKRERRKTRT